MRIVLFFMLAFCHLPLFAASAVDFENKRIALTLGEEPNLFSPRVTDSESMFVLAHIMEGLLQFGENNRLLPGAAERWQLRDDGATFFLRPDARWRDGRPVVAADFVYAWQRIVEPETAAPYASLLFPIRNAESIVKGLLPASELGVSAPEPLRLEVSFERPCPYFLKLMPFVTFLPLRQDWLELHGRRYGAERDLLMTNGAFNLSSWVHGASLSLDKNPDYWNAEQINLNGIDIPYITADASARINLFRNDQIAYTRVFGDTYSLAAATGQPMYTFADGFIYYLLFNQRAGRQTAQLKLREAISRVIDSREIAAKVLPSPSNKALYSQLPSIVKVGDQNLEALYPVDRYSPDLDRARAALAEAKAALGTDIEPLTLLVSDTPSAIKLAEYLQFIMQYGLGLTVYLDKQTFKQRLAKRAAGQFDMVITNWGPDYDDALTYAELFASWNNGNSAHIRSDDYDYWLRQLQQRLDPDERAEAMRTLRALVRSEFFIAPLYESGSIYLKHTALKNVYRSAFGGDPNLRFVEIEQ